MDSGSRSPKARLRASSTRYGSLGRNDGAIGSTFHGIGRLVPPVVVGLWLDLLLLLEDRLRSKGCGLRRGDRPVAALEPFQLLGKGGPFSGKQLQLGSEVWVGGQHRAPPCFMCPRLIPVYRHSSPQRIDRNADRAGMVPVSHEKSVGRVRRS